MAALKYWLWLTTAPALSNRAKLLLLEHFSSPEDVYYAQPDQLCLVEGITRQQAESLSDKSLARAEKVLADCARDGQFIVTMDDAAYPARLRDMYDPPVLLYGKGSMPLFDEEAAVAVVGTRKCSPYGTRAASQLGYELARQGGLVISGLAKGIDGAAHQGALRAGGFTAAVLGGGADVVYPPENRRLYEDIAATGVILSEYPPGTVEASAQSGALITARLALEQGRDVFAVPGPINAASSRGCNQLIRDGAGLVMEAWDVLGTYQQRFPQKLRPIRAVLPETPGSAEAEPASASAQPVRQPEKAPALPILNMAREGAALTDDQQRILRMLPTDRPLLADEAAVATDLPVRRVLSALTMLEIDGYVCRQGAGSFLRTVELKEE